MRAKSDIGGHSVLKSRAAPADTRRVSSTATDDLQAAYDVYRAASRAWRSAAAGGVRSAHVDTCAEQLVLARVRLYEALSATGWEAPPAVVLQLERDRALTSVPDDLEALIVGGRA